MKRLVLLALVMIPLFAFTQEIKSNVVDGFTNDRTIETSIVTLKQGFSTGFGVSYTAVNKMYYLNIVGYGNGKTLIKDQDKIWLVLSNGQVVKLNSRVDLSYNETEYRNIYIHHYYINLNDVEILKNNKLSIVRIVAPIAHNDVAVSKKNSKSFSKLSEVFLKEVSKY